MEREPTRDDVDALVGPATPHFAYQLRARVRELVAGLPADHDVRRTRSNRWSGSTGSATPRRRRTRARARRATRPGWDEIPSSAPADDPLPPGVNVFVTGGSRGIGRAIALRFARDGAKRVAIGYLRNDRAAEETAEELRASAPSRCSCAATSPRSACSTRSRRSGRSTCSCTTRRPASIRPALETEDKHWDWTMNANARALLQLARVAAPQMPAGSSIVAISSLGAQRVLENYVLVGTSKAALESLVRYLAVELAPRGIRVNAVSGGVVETGALEHFPNREEMLARRRREPGRPPRRARRHRRRGRVPLLARTPRWSAARRSSSTAASRSSPDTAAASGLMTA